jgi:hypothetical protein
LAASAAAIVIFEAIEDEPGDVTDDVMGEDPGYPPGPK